jgi:replicative DNA helicase
VNDLTTTAELTIAAGILAGGKIPFSEARALLSSEDFACLAARCVFEAAAAIADKGGEFSITSIASKCDALDTIGAVGGLPGLERLAADHDRPADREMMAKRIAEASALRKTGQRLAKLAKYAAHPEAVENPERYHAAVAAISAGSRERMRRGTVTSSESVVLMMQALTERGRWQAAAPTNLTEVNRMLGGGLQKKRLYVIGARPAVGKSAFAVGAMFHAAERGHPQLMFSCEMPVEDIVGRAICQRLHLDSDRFARVKGQNALHTKDMEAIVGAATKFARMPYELDCETRDLGAMLARARVWLDTVARPMIAKHVEEHGQDDAKIGLVPVVWIDYIQRCHLAGKWNSREERIGTMSDMLASFARDEECAVVALSQVGRGSAKENRPPTMADLRESGSIEQDANVVILIHRDSGAKVEEDGEPAGRQIESEAKFIKDKDRHGATGVASVTFHGPCGLFEDSKDGWS